MLNVTVNNQGDAVILQCDGRLVRGEEAALLCPASKLSGRDVVLELSQVDTIDAAGIGALIALQAAGIYLKIANPSKAVRQVLSVTRIDSIFEMVPGLSTEAVPYDVNGRSPAFVPGVTPAAV